MDDARQDEAINKLLAHFIAECKNQNSCCKMCFTEVVLLALCG